MVSRKRIAIVGGGLCGIGSIVNLKEEGLEPICFEQQDKFGGTWYYREEVKEGLASIMPTTIINTSKEFGATSNFPPRKEFNNYMRHNEMYEYVTEYVKTFDVERHIRYNSEVTLVKKAEDYEETGRWSVTVKDLLSGKLSTDVYDGVLVCVGQLTHPKMPTFPKQENFKGKIMHVHSLKDVTKYKGQNVVVVGIGCSALDAACEISSFAKQVYLSTRSGAFITNRVGPKGRPFDYFLLRRCVSSLLYIFPVKLCSWFIERFILDLKYDHRLYTVKPKYHWMCKDPTITDQLPSKLLSGAVIQKTNIAYFTENGVVLEGDTEITVADSIILATGYSFKFPFLEEGTLVIEDGRINLYKCMFPPQLTHPTLAFIGFFLPFGPAIPIGEIQCRWAAHVLSGKGTMPSKRKMIADIHKRHSSNMKRYPPDEKTTIRVDYVPYMDELSSQFGAKPNFLKLFFTDIRLFFKLWFGPSLPYQYRLQGPHKWDGAREAIMSCDERVFWPLTKRQ